MRVEKPLNYNWKFTRKTNDKGYSKMVSVDIPHTNQIVPFNNFDEKAYQFESVYQKTFTINKKEDTRYFIKFEGVLHHSKVYINEQFIGEHKNGYTSFKFEITDHVKQSENILVVEVDSRESLNQPPFGSTIDYLTYGGIYREVTLIETPNNYIEDVSIKSFHLLTAPQLVFDVAVSGGKTLTITLQKKGELVYKKDFKVGNEIVIELDVELWDLETPNLYDIDITLDGNDSYQMRTGFREAQFRNDGFYLNGKNVKLIGLNRHQMFPYVGYAMPQSAQEKDAEILKTMCNSVRTSHYPQSKHFLNACDSLGILVFTEAPGWQHIGDEEWQLLFKDSVSDMIYDNKHHPSIVLWGVRVNESPDDNKLYTMTNNLSRDLDERQTGGVRCFSYSEFLEDVYTYNDFHYNGTNSYLKNIDEVLTDESPYLITEFMGHMYPTKTFDNQEKQLEHALRYAKIINEINADERICGGFGWNFSDYFTHSEFGSGDHICYHGVLDVFRLQKPAAKVYESQYSKDIYLELLHAIDYGDYSNNYIEKFVFATNCDYIEVYQNEKNIGRFYPDKETYHSLKNPLIFVDDFYGNAFDDFDLSESEIQELKNLAEIIAQRGGMDKISKDDNYDEDKVTRAWKMYGKHKANWGSEIFKYTIVGYLGDKKIEKTYGPYNEYSYDIRVDSNTLQHKNTYDVTRVVIQAKDNYFNLRPYSFDAFKISTEGSIEIIGDTYISLIGGQRAFWIKSVSKGDGVINIENDSFTTSLSIKVI